MPMELPFWKAAWAGHVIGCTLNEPPRRVRDGRLTFHVLEFGIDLYHSPLMTSDRSLSGVVGSLCFSVAPCHPNQLSSLESYFAARLPCPAADSGNITLSDNRLICA